MDPITAPTIPESYVSFAKAVAALADSHGVTSCQIKITPDWRDNARHIHGDVQINYAAKDGRGRPDKTLNVYLGTHTTLPLPVIDDIPAHD